jgi:hypothetical protein
MSEFWYYCYNINASLVYNYHVCMYMFDESTLTLY